MMIKMLLEEAGQYFYCEARKTASHEFEGMVHFLHKLGDGNAFVRGKTHHVKSTFTSRNDALTAAERYGKQIANHLAPAPARCDDSADFDAGAQTAARTGNASQEKPAC